MRTAKINRKTNETEISLELELDGRGKGEINTGAGFLDHMLILFAGHSRVNLNIICKGDTQVDYHHTTEDVGMVLGEAFGEALGNKKGIKRYGQRILPMDEALILAAVDFSGRGYLGYSMEMTAEKVGDFETELIEEFWRAFVRKADCTLHINQLSGMNTHHIAEGVFKAAARAIREAIEIDRDFAEEIPSTKGVL